MLMSRAYFYLLLWLIGCIFLSANVSNSAMAAENLKLREGISFSQDIDSDFPIVAEKMDDYAFGDNCPTFIFFGARGDLNTNRQAKRLVDLYKKYSKEKVKFVVVDVDQIKNAQGRELVKKYYHGYIPDQVLLDNTGHQVWTQIGEIDGHLISKAIDKLL